MKSNKIKKIDEIIKLIDKLKKQKKIVVTTNGCFDIIHSGHVEYLKKAKSFGDVLIIALNSDISVKKYKGDKRPINNWTNRAKVLEGLESVDYIVKFNEKTPVMILNKIKSHIHVKGGDYKKEDLPEYNTIIKNGGKIKIVKYIRGISTTNIIKKILEISK